MFEFVKLHNSAGFLFHHDIFNVKWTTFQCILQTIYYLLFVLKSCYTGSLLQWLNWAVPCSTQVIPNYPKVS